MTSLARLAGWHASNFDGNLSSNFFLQLPISDVKSKSLFAALASQILKLTPQLLILSNNYLIIAPSNSFQPRRCRLSCSLAAIIKFSVITSVIRSSKYSSSGIMFSGSMSNKG